MDNFQTRCLGQDASTSKKIWPNTIQERGPALCLPVSEPLSGCKTFTVKNHFPDETEEGGNGQDTFREQRNDFELVSSRWTRWRSCGVRRMESLYAADCRYHHGNQSDQLAWPMQRGSRRRRRSDENAGRLIGELKRGRA